MAVLITDLVGSTEMTHRLGEEHARELLHEHDAIVRQERARHHGVEVKHTGDGLMLRFEDAWAAAACATAIQARLAGRNHTTPDDPLHVRIGIAFGEVVDERDDLFGTTVVLAVRITDQADAGRVFVSESVREMAGDAFAFDALRSLELKGFPEPVGVYELLWMGE
jgi:class 3 adenylate cyclase